MPFNGSLMMAQCQYIIVVACFVVFYETALRINLRFFVCYPVLVQVGLCHYVG